MERESTPSVAKAVPSDEEVRLGMVRTMDAIFLHAQAGERLLLAIQAQVAGTMAVAGVVDDNHSQVQTDREVAAQKEVITFLYEKSHQYVTLVVGGAESLPAKAWPAGCQLGASGLRFRNSSRSATTAHIRQIAFARTFNANDDARGDSLAGETRS